MLAENINIKVQNVIHTMLSEKPSSRLCMLCANQVFYPVKLGTGKKINYSVQTLIILILYILGPATPFLCNWLPNNEYVL